MIVDDHMHMTTFYSLASGPDMTVHDYDCHVISPQLTVRCHDKITPPCEMTRGSATNTMQYA